MIASPAISQQVVPQVTTLHSDDVVPVIVHGAATAQDSYMNALLLSGNLSNLSGVYNAVTMGNADNTGTLNGTANLALLQAGLNRASGAAIPFIQISPFWIPGGSYNIAGSLVAPSNSDVECAQGATLYQVNASVAFSNTNAQRIWTSDFTAATRANATDHDITINKCTVNATTAGSTPNNFQIGPGLAAFLLAQRVHVTYNSYYGDTTGNNTNQIGNVVRFAKDFDSNAYQNFGQGVYNGVGIWGGSQNVTATFNTYTLAPNNTNANFYSCSNINGMGTAAGDHQTTSQITYSDNTCYTNGGSSVGVFAYNNGALSSGSAVNDLIFERNRTIVQSGTDNGCFSANGALDGWVVKDNYFYGCNNTPFIITPHAVAWGAQTNPFTTTNTSSSVVATIAGVTVANVSVGNYMLITGATGFNGLTLANGYYQITAVDPAGGDFTFNAGQTANASGSGGGTPTVSTYWGSPRNYVIDSNRFVNVTATSAGIASDAVIVTEGPNGSVTNNSAENSTYGALTFTYQGDCCSSVTPTPIIVSGNKGPAGSGMTSPRGGFTVAGDNFFAYASGSVPTILDYAAIASHGTWTPVIQIAGVTPGDITYSTQSGQYWLNGKQMFACFDITLTSKGVSTGAVTIIGLPSAPFAFAMPWVVQQIRNFSAGDNTFVPTALSMTTPAGGAPALVLYVNDSVATQVDNSNLINSSVLNACGTYATP
jgi:hypothetical protein